MRIDSASSPYGCRRQSATHAAGEGDLVDRDHLRHERRRLRSTLGSGRRPRPSPRAAWVCGLIDLDPIEEARGLRRLIEEFGLTHEDVAQRLGKHRVSVTQSLSSARRMPRRTVGGRGGVITLATRRR